MLSHDQLQKIQLNQQELKLNLRIERYQYLGILEEYQLHPPSLINSFACVLLKVTSICYTSLIV